MATGWTGPLVAAIALWAIVGVACLPLLKSARIRALFERWPTERLGVNYLVLSGLAVIGHAATFLGGVVVTGGFRGTALVRWTIAAAVGYPIALGGITGAVATSTGRWPAAAGHRGSWFALGLAVLWYTIVVVVAAMIAFFVLFVLYFPG